MSTNIPVEKVPLRQGILQAADHIEAHPEQFNFVTADVPHNCDSPGCALGWIHYFTRVHGFQNDIGEELVEASYLDPELEHDGHFYERMDRVAPKNWRNHAQLCATGLRAYVKEYCRD